MDADKTVIAHFRETMFEDQGYTSPSDGGRISGPLGVQGSAAMSEAGPQTFTSIPSEGYVFTGWSGDCWGTDTCTLVIDSDKEINANFSEISTNQSQVVFSSDRDGNYEIYVMNSDGTGQTRLTENDSENYSPSWSPDGSQIVFQSYRDGNAEIYVMNADGTGETRLTENEAFDTDPAFGPGSLTGESYAPAEGVTVYPAGDPVSLSAVPDEP